MTGTLELYARLLRHFPLRVATVFVVGGIASVVEGTALLVLVPLIDTATGEAEAGDGMTEMLTRPFEWVGVEPTLTAVLVVFAGLALLSAVLNHVAVTEMHRLVGQVERRMRSELFSAVTRMEWTAFSRQTSATLVQALYGDVQAAGTGVLNLAMASMAALSAIAYLVLALVLAWQFTLGAIVVGLVLSPIYVYFSRRGEALGRESGRLSEQLLSETTELLHNAKPLFSQGLRQSVREVFDSVVRQYQKVKVRQDIQSERLRVAWEVAAVAFVASFLYLFLEVRGGEVSRGLVWVGAFYRLAPRAISVQMFLVRALSHGGWLANWARTLEAANDAPEPHPTGGAPALVTELRVDGLTFAYPGAATPVLEDVSLRIGAGETVAIVGPSGHGKTTIVDMLTGLLRPTSGAVLVDGVPLGAADVGAWQGQLGLVLQESPMLRRSVAENVAFGERDPDPERVWEALRLAQADGFVRRLPHGIDSVLGERGGSLSGGQRQRLALARALYRRPHLLLLDEPTSAVDAATERAIADSIGALKGSTTIVIVSHGGGLLPLADRCYVVEAGTVRELTAAESQALVQR